MLVVMAEAGNRPGGRGTFLCFAKEKYPKERRPPVCDPFAERRGKPAACRLQGAPQNSLRAGALRSDNCGESVHEAWALRRPCSPRNRPAAGAASRGGAAEHPNSRTAIRAIAALGPVCAACGACAREVGPSAAMARVDVLPPICPSGCAEERRVWRIRARDCLSEASSSETPPNPSTAGCPGAQRRGRRQWGRPFFGSFLSATRKKGTRLPGDSRPPPSKKASHSMRANPQTQHAQQMHEAVNFRRRSPVP